MIAPMSGACVGDVRGSTSGASPPPIPCRRQPPSSGRHTHVNVCGMLTVWVSVIIRACGSLAINHTYATSGADGHDRGTELIPYSPSSAPAAAEKSPYAALDSGITRLRSPSTISGVAPTAATTLSAS